WVRVNSAKQRKVVGPGKPGFLRQSGILAKFLQAGRRGRSGPRSTGFRVNLRGYRLGSADHRRNRDGAQANQFGGPDAGIAPERERIVSRVLKNRIGRA